MAKCVSSQSRKLNETSEDGIKSMQNNEQRTGFLQQPTKKKNQWTNEWTGSTNGLMLAIFIFIYTIHEYIIVLKSKRR